MRIQDLNFDMKVLTVHDGKGQKDRTLPMPESLMNPLSRQVEQAALLHERDLAANYAGVFLPGALDVKYKNAAKKLAFARLLGVAAISH